jgi:cytochrome c oxidase assembly factor CtaG/polyferredoxin
MSPVADAVLASWSIPIWTMVGLLFTCLLYVRGWRSLRPLHATVLPKRRLACFLAGIGSLWVAIASPLDTFANLLLTVHMIQHLLLMLVAPPLILLASPEIPLLRGLPRWVARDVLGPFLTWPLLKHFGRALTNPAFCLLAAAVALLGWHVPAAYDVALLSPGWHQVEHACFFATSLLFWWPVIQPWPGTPHWPRWTIPAYLLCGAIVSSVLGALLCFSDQPLYRAYEAAPRLFGLSALDDQIAAGAVMWVFGSFVLLGAAVVVTVDLLDPAAITPKPNVKPAPRPRFSFDLLQAPVAGPLLRARYGRRALQAILLVIAAAVIADGFFGHPMAPMNLAGVLPWTYARAFVVVALLAAGNLFCMACPFTLPRELGRRLGLATRHWPRALRSKWLAAGLLGLFFWAYEAFDLWDSPLLTAWILVGYFATAFAVDTFFRGASFCKYVCPIGQFNFVSSLVSPLEVRIRRRDACAACSTHDCLRGNERHRGCELGLFLPRKVGNMDCTFCLDCVKACPHDNIGILAIAPGRDLLRDPARSSLGRFSRRPDIAALAIVLVSSAFLTAAAMAPVPSWCFLAGLALTTFLVGAPLAGKRLGRIARPTRELCCRFSLALVPLGLAMWGAHVLFHLSTCWSTAWPVLQRAAGDLGAGWLGTPLWTASSPLLTADTLLEIQIALLDAGVLLSLYVGWRVAHACASRVGDALRLFFPWALVVAGLYAAGVWVFLQPMQMRGMLHG